ncbi:high copy suppressor of abf2 [Massospora cicadina]|nr:high copy suppressor of abf2 [Massospora cicadina]
MVATPNLDRAESGLSRFVGSGCSGILELLGFHPIDTVAKRLMSNTKPIFATGAPVAEGFANLNQVIFKDAHTKSFGKKYASLFPGLGFAAGYKITQRIYKYGGQPYAKDFLNTHGRSFFTNTFGEKTGKTVMHATAGSIVGVGEIALLPLDVLKIKSQTNPETLKGRGIFTLIREEGLGLYRGAMWTAARNAPGSFALFGGAAVVKEYGFGLKDYSQATFLQNFCASISGAAASITVAAPLDVVKTRIQNRPFDAPESGLSIVRSMVRKEGLRSFFKGLTPKLLVVGPKLIFSFTVAQQLIPVFHDAFESAGITKTTPAL